MLIVPGSYLYKHVTMSEVVCNTLCSVSHAQPTMMRSSWSKTSSRPRCLSGGNLPSRRQAFSDSPTPTRQRQCRYARPCSAPGQDRRRQQQERTPMHSYLEQYPSKQNGVTLHTWTEREGRKEENFYLTGLSGTPVAAWFREKLRTKHLPDLLDFP